MNTPELNDQVSHLVDKIYHAVNVAAHPDWYENCDPELINHVALHDYWQIKLPSFFDSVVITVWNNGSSYSITVSSLTRRGKDIDITKFYSGDIKEEIQPNNFVSLANEIIELDVTASQALMDRASIDPNARTTRVPRVGDRPKREVK